MISIKKLNLSKKLMTNNKLTKSEIIDLLPHREPMLLSEDALY